MPIYEYRCSSCRHTFEVIQKFSDAPVKRCSECSGPVEKMVSRTSFHLKGGGWFLNDYSGARGSDKTGSSDATETKGKSESKAAEGGTSPSKPKAAGCGEGGCAN